MVGSGLGKRLKMENKEVVTPDALNRFLGKYIGNRYCLELLRFLGAHPRARFNRLAVIRAFNESGHKEEFERALIHLMDKGIVKAYIENNAHLYALTEDEPIHTQVCELARLEWPHWQLALTRACSPTAEGNGQRWGDSRRSRGEPS